MGRFEERLNHIGKFLTVELTGMTEDGRRALVDQLNVELRHIQENTTGLAAVEKIVSAIVEQL